MSIAVIAVARSGSTYYVESLAKETGYKAHIGSWFSPYFNLNNYFSIQLKMNSLNKKCGNYQPCIFKIFSNHWQHWQSIGVMNINKLLFNIAECHFLIRKNYNDQLKSYYAGRKYDEINNWHNEVNEYNIKYDEDQYLEWDAELQKRYRDTADLYHSLEHPNKKLVYYEDFATPEKRYKRNFIWDKEPKHIDFHPEKLFTDK